MDVPNFDRPAGIKAQRYLTYRIGPEDDQVLTIVDVYEVDPDTGKAKVRLHQRREYTLDDCKAVTRWLNHRDEVLNAADRLATACSNYYDETGKWALRIVMHPRFYHEVIQTIPLRAVHDLIRQEGPTFYGVPIIRDCTCDSDYSLIAPDGQPVNLSHL